VHDRARVLVVCHSLKEALITLSARQMTLETDDTESFAMHIFSPTEESLCLKNGVNRQRTLTCTYFHIKQVSS